MVHREIIMVDFDGTLTGVKYHGLNFDKPGAQIYLDDKSINSEDLGENIGETGE